MRLGQRRLLILMGIAAAIALAVTVAVVVWPESGSDGPGMGEQIAVPETAPAVNIEPRARTDVDLAAPATFSARTYAVDIDVPSDAVEMQVGTDPTMRTVPWVEVAPQAQIDASNLGYQTVFLRFRGADEIASPITTLGVEITSDGATETAEPRVGVAGPGILVVEIEDGRLARGGVGERDELVGERFSTEELDAGEWSVEVDGSSYTVASVNRITRPIGSGTDAADEVITATRHQIFLAIDGTVESGSLIQVASRDRSVEAEVNFDDGSSWSPSVHVNDIGHRPDDAVKVALLSGWTGAGGPIAFGEPPHFRVVDLDGIAAYEGTGSERVAGPDGELGRGDLTGSSAWELDYSALTADGTYRVCVDDIGCSEAFEINNDVWLRLAATVARAMYHQRSGIALTAEHTSVVRPETYTEAAGVTVRQSTYTRLEGFGLDPNATFEGLVAGATDEVIPGLSGGHYDAGDWDRRIDHMSYVRDSITVYESNPALWADVDLNIPESGDAIPDILDEALWTVDLFRRLQTPDGGVRGGIEAEAHPEPGSVSWEETLDVYAFAPDPYSSYVYASVAAEMATVLRDLDPAKADDLTTSAVAAHRWALDQPVDPQHVDRVLSQRAAAAAALFRLTEDQTYHDELLSIETITAEPSSLLECHGLTWCDVAWIYLRTDADLVDPELHTISRHRLRLSADAVVEAADTTVFGWTVEDPGVPLVWGLGPGGGPKVRTLLLAYLAWGDERYRDLALRSTSVSLGMNPLNTAMFTGFGDRSVTDPLIVDVNSGGLPLWPGTPVYGPHQLSGDEYWVQQYFLEPFGVTPSAYDVPYLWQWFDIHRVAALNEFTVHQSHGPAILAFGLLAGVE